MKKIICGGLLLFAGLAVFFLVAEPASVAPVPASGAVGLTRPEVASASLAPVAAGAPCDPGVTEPAEVRQFPIGRLAGQVQLELAAGLDHPALVQPKAGQGQAAAAIATLYLAANCSRFRGRFEFFGLVPDEQDLPSGQICRQLPPQLRRSPLTALDQVLSDSAEAQLLYAANGLLIRQARLADGAAGMTGQDNDELASLEQNALRAAHAGVGEAYLFLAARYDDGSFGAVDADKAWYFAQRFRADRPDPGEVQRLAYFRQRLQGAARPSAACGHGAAHPLSNPFSGAKAAG